VEEEKLNLLREMKQEKKEFLIQFLEPVLGGAEK